MIRPQLKHHCSGKVFADHPSLVQPPMAACLASFPLWQSSVAQMVVSASLWSGHPTPGISLLQAGPLSPSLPRPSGWNSVGAQLVVDTCLLNKRMEGGCDGSPFRVADGLGSRKLDPVAKVN